MILEKHWIEIILKYVQSTVLRLDDLAVSIDEVFKFRIMRFWGFFKIFIFISSIREFLDKTRAL